MPHSQHAFLRKVHVNWVFSACAVGIAAGTLALTFGVALSALTRYSLRSWMGLGSAAGLPHPFWIVLFPTLGGLVSGLLCTGIAPQASGGGTDGAIRAFHHEQGRVSPWLVPVKFLATLFTLGSGGAGGSEGPIAQMGAGCGSLLGQQLDLGDRRTRILLVAGMAAGVGALFEAPLAAMIFAGEILYRGADIDGEVLVPSAIASVVSYSIYVGGMSWVSGAVRWAHMFRVPAWTFSSGFELIGYTVLALACGLAARAWISLFYRVQRGFDDLSVPTWIKPALGGLATGLLAAWLLRDGTRGLAPGVLGDSFAYLQQALNSELTATIAVQLIVLKALATAFTVGSGGSAGVFGPSLILGGLLGFSVGSGLQALHPALVVDPGAYAMVGMAALFGAAAHAPICSVIMVSEITRSYGLLVPSIWVCTLAFLFVGRESLYSQQVLHIEDSPAHRGEMRWNILGDLRCGEWMTTPVVWIHEADTFDQIERIMLLHRSLGKFPVLDDDEHVVGVISVKQIRQFFNDPDIRDATIARDAMDPSPAQVTTETTLREALEILDEKELRLLPVISKTKNGVLSGILTRRDILLAYNHEMTRRNKTWEEF